MNAQEPQFVAPGSLVAQLMQYLLSRPMGEVEQMVAQIRQMREASVVAPPEQKAS